MTLTLKCEKINKHIVSLHCEKYVDGYYVSANEVMNDEYLMTRRINIKFYKDYEKAQKRFIYLVRKFKKEEE